MCNIELGRGGWVGGWVWLTHHGRTMLSGTDTTALVSPEKNLSLGEAAASHLSLWLYVTGVSCRPEIAADCLMGRQPGLRDQRRPWLARFKHSWFCILFLRRAEKNLPLILTAPVTWPRPNSLARRADGGALTWCQSVPLCRFRVLRPPGGESSFSLGTEDNTTPQRKNKMASNIFAEPEDPHAHRRNNPPSKSIRYDICYLRFVWHAYADNSAKKTMRERTLEGCVSTFRRENLLNLKELPEASSKQKEPCN